MIHTTFFRLWSLLFAFACVQAAQAGELAKRVVGTWQSDKEQTVRSIRFPDGYSEEQKEKACSVFGKLVISYTPEVICALPNATAKPDAKHGTVYRVVKEEDGVLTLEVVATAQQQAYRMVLHFVDKDTYRTRLAGGVGYEDFVRVKP